MDQFSNNKSTFQGFIDAFLPLAFRFKNVVVLDAGSNAFSNHTSFAAQIPYRYYPMGNAYADAVGVASGMALRGKTPFVFGPAAYFVGSAFEVIKTQCCLANISVHLVVVDDDFSTSRCPDLAIPYNDFFMLRGFPNLKLFYPVNYEEACSFFSGLMRSYGPVYIRLSKKKVPTVYSQGFQFSSGKAHVSGDAKEVGIITFGELVSNGLFLVELLHRQHVSASVMSLSTLQPLDVEGIFEFVNSCATVFVLDSAKDSMRMLSAWLAPLFMEHSLKRFETLLFDAGLNDMEVVCRRMLAFCSNKEYKVA